MEASFGHVKLRINPRRCETWCQLDEIAREKLSNTWHRSGGLQWAGFANDMRSNGIPTRVRKTTVRTTPVRSQQCECQQCERVNSANANSANATAVRMRQQCERRFSEPCKTVPSVETTRSGFFDKRFVLLYPSFTHKISTIGVRNSAWAFDFGGRWSTDFFRQCSEKVHESTEKTTTVRGIESSALKRTS